MKYSHKKEYIGLSKALPIHKATLPLPEWITTEKQFADWLESKWGAGEYYIPGERKGFYVIFRGTIRDGKAIGRGAWKKYLFKNKERLERNALKQSNRK